MSAFRRISSVGRRTPSISLLTAAIVAGFLAAAPVQAAKFGHSRLVSAVGEPLRITIPVTELSAAEAESLRIVPAPVSSWADAGLTPPVDPATLNGRLDDGYAPGAKVIQVWSDQVFSKPIADLLLDIHTSSGVQRYQVSLLARGGAAAVQAPLTDGVKTQGQSAGSASDVIVPAPLLVRRGDTMFAFARRHAVQGVTVYQMMMALQRANPHAFIHQNVNLVKAGESLEMPDMEALTAISDREARRLFHEQVVAFNAYRQGQGDLIAGEASSAQAMLRDPATAEGLSNIPESRVAGGDQLKLSSGRSVAVSDTGATSVDASTATAEHAAVQQGVSAEPQGGVAQNMAAGVSGTAHAANSVSSESGGIAGSDAVLNDAAGNATGAAQAGADNPPTTSQTPAATSGAAGANDDGAAADDAVATRKAIEDAEMRVSVLEENVKNLNQALQSQGEAAIDVVVDGALGLRQSLTDVATAVTEATIGDEDFLDGPAGQDSAGAEGASPSTQDNANATTSKMESITNWVQSNIIAAITVGLALIVLIIAWVLRRANIVQSRSESAITPEMVQEKLDQINLDLNEPTVGDTRPRT